jgi:hypothetical protein
MSNIHTVTKHIYLTKWGIQDVHNGKELTACDVHLDDSAESSSDYRYHVCPVEINVEIPDSDTYQLMQLAGLEGELARVREQSLARMKNLTERIQELKALAAPVSMSTENPYANVEV